jgi:hypothetical protein
MFMTKTYRSAAQCKYRPPRPYYQLTLNPQL